jgi:hypothetical protein
MAKLQSTYIVIVSKSQNLLELECFFHVDCDSIFQIPLDFYIILALNALLFKNIGKLPFRIVIWCIQSCFHLKNAKSTMTNEWWFQVWCFYSCPCLGSHLAILLSNFPSPMHAINQGKDTKKLLLFVDVKQLQNVYLGRLFQLCGCDKNSFCTYKMFHNLHCIVFTLCDNNMH